MSAKRNRRTSSAARISETISTARQLFASQFPSEDFDAVSWKLQPLINRPGIRRTRYLNFSRLKRLDEPLPESFASVIKSWIVLDGLGHGSRSLQLLAARHFWEVLLLRRNKQADGFRWDTLTLDDLCQAELSFLSNGERAAYRNSIHLKQLVRFLEARQICPPLHFTVQVSRPESSDTYISRERAKKGSKLPSPQALSGLAAVFHQLATEPADRLRIDALALLVVTGFRIGELLSLPLDCEVEEIYQGEKQYGLRYYREKARGEALQLAVRWLTPVGAQLARKAIAEIRVITAPFREQARRLEQNPSNAVLSNHQGAEKLTPQEAQEILGMKSLDTLLQNRPTRFLRRGSPGHPFYLVSEVAAYLLSCQHTLWTLDRRDGTYQWLSETLLIAPRWFFRPRNRVNPLLIEQVSYTDILNFLASPFSSVFKCFNICEADGSVCRMTTHQFRHWLNDLADKGGLSLDLQARWFGRENQQDNFAYHHATIEERVEWAEQGIREGTIRGHLADVYFALPEEDRNLFLEGQVQAVHFTALGLCLHDFNLDPCPFHLNCLRGCRDYLRTKGNQQERTNLIQIQKRTEHSLLMAKEAARTGKGVLAEAWIRHNEETLVGCQAALAIDDETPGVPAGTLVRPFEGHPSKFQSL